MSAPAASEPPWHTIAIRIPFISEKHARIAKQVIEVDKELQPHAVKRQLEVENDILVACAVQTQVDILGHHVDLAHSTFTTATIRLARLTANAFLENVDLVVRTIGEFGEGAERGPPK